MHERVGGRSGRPFWFGLAIVGLLLPASARGQTPGSTPLGLNDAVRLAIANYPAIRASRARAQAAEEGIGVARTAYLPRLDMLWQANRATRNNVFGLVLPQAVISPISGPVLGGSSSDSIWGTAAGALLSWEVVDFGQRKASVDLARAQSSLAKARTEVTELDVAGAAADAFLTVLATEEGVRAVRANVARLQVFADAVRTLVANQLRPGADESRANAELAIARNQLSQAVQGTEVARAALAEAIGTAGTPVDVMMGPMASPPAVRTTGPAELESHPAARAERAAVEAVRARERLLDRAYVPRVTFQSSVASRGSGGRVPGQPPPGSGLWPHVPNWAAGVSVSFPALDVFSVTARKRVEVQNELAERAQYDRTLQNLTTQQARAAALLTAATEIALNTPIERQAAADAESRARARYQNGLASITEVADAQRLLAQAEADDSLARLGLWRALLAAAQVRGDLKPFLDQTLRP